jgi:hypothetical protein
MTTESPPDATTFTVLVLVRHGETLGNREGRFQTYGTPLSDTGRTQASRLAERIAAEHRVRAIYTSDLTRALETATIIGDRLGLTPIPDRAFRELDVGDWKGLLRPDVMEQFPGGFDGWLADGGREPLPGAEGSTRSSHGTPASRYLSSHMAWPSPFCSARSMAGTAPKRFVRSGRPRAIRPSTSSRRTSRACGAARCLGAPRTWRGRAPPPAPPSLRGRGIRISPAKDDAAFVFSAGDQGTVLIVCGYVERVAAAVDLAEGGGSRDLVGVGESLRAFDADIHADRLFVALAEVGEPLAGRTLHRAGEVGEQESGRGAAEGADRFSRFATFGGGVGHAGDESGSHC